jgi:hypothetical protein
MTGRMWFAVIFVLLVFIGVEIFLYAGYQNQTNQEVLHIQSRLNNKELLNLTANETLQLESELSLKQDTMAQIWNFCGTTAFDKVTLGLLLVVVMAAIGGIFKIDNAIEEKVRNDRQKRIDAQTKCIEKTAEMWNELYCIVSEVRFYDRERVEKLKNAKDGKGTVKNIDEILACLENFASKAEDIVNTWQFMFPRLPEMGNELKKEKIKEYKREWKIYHSGKSTKESKQEIEKKLKFNQFKASTLILSYVNVLYDAASSVGYFIKKDGGNEHTGDMQESLGVIQDVIKGLAHHTILSLLKNSVDPLDSHQSNKSVENTRENIKKYINRMHNDISVLKKWEYENPPLLIMKKDKAYTAFQNETQKFMDWVKSRTESEELKEKEKDEQRNIYDDLLVSFGKAMNDVFEWSRNLMESPKSKADKEVEKRQKEKEENAKKYSTLRMSFDNMVTEGPDGIINAWEFKYTEDYLKKLAHNLAFHALTIDLRDRVTWS